MTLGTKGLTFPTNFTSKIKKTNPKASPSVIPCSLTDEQGRIVLLLPQAMLLKICILVGSFALSYGSEPEALVPPQTPSPGGVVADPTTLAALGDKPLLRRLKKTHPLLRA